MTVALSVYMDQDTDDTIYGIGYFDPPWSLVNATPSYFFLVLIHRFTLRGRQI